MILPVLILAVGLVLLRRWFPSLYGLIRRLGILMLKKVAGWLWRRPERKGGASIKPARMRWRP